MGIERFTGESGYRFSIEYNGSDARPRLSEETHELVKEFTQRAGTDISTSYNMILQHALNNDEIITQILESASTSIEVDVDDLSEHHKSLVDDIAELAETLGEFPSREDINQDTICLGYPIYIQHLGSYDKLLKAIKKEHPEVYEQIDEEV